MRSYEQVFKLWAFFQPRIVAGDDYIYLPIHDTYPRVLEGKQDMGRLWPPSLHSFPVEIILNNPFTNLADCLLASVFSSGSDRASKHDVEPKKNNKMFSPISLAIYDAR